MTTQQVSGAGAQTAAATTDPKQLKHIIVDAGILAVGHVLSEATDVSEEEADMLLTGLRALINRIFGHKAA